MEKVNPNLSYKQQTNSNELKHKYDHEIMKSFETNAGDILKDLRTENYINKI